MKTKYTLPASEAVGLFEECSVIHLNQEPKYEYSHSAKVLCRPSSPLRVEPKPKLLSRIWARVRRLFGRGKPATPDIGFPISNAHPGTAISRSTIGQVRAGTNDGFDLTEGWWILSDLTKTPPPPEITTEELMAKMGYPITASGTLYQPK